MCVCVVVCVRARVCACVLCAVCCVCVCVCVQITGDPSCTSGHVTAVEVRVTLAFDLDIVSLKRLATAFDAYHSTKSSHINTVINMFSDHALFDETAYRNKFARFIDPYVSVVCAKLREFRISQ